MTSTVAKYDSAFQHKRYSHQASQSTQYVARVRFATAEQQETELEPNGARIRLLTADEVLAAHRLEVEAYPANCGASLQTMRYRQAEAPNLFLGCFNSSQELLGYVVGTRYHENHLTADSMKVHIPTGESICIHSVVVAKSHRRKGIALRLLQRFLERARRSEPGTHRVLLVCVAQHVPLYTRAGFTLSGPAAVAIDHRQWYECELQF